MTGCSYYRTINAITGVVVLFNSLIVGSLNYLYEGVIARSLYYLFYWERDDHVTETDFRQDIVPAIGGVIVEVRFNYSHYENIFFSFSFSLG